MYTDLVLTSGESIYNCIHKCKLIHQMSGLVMSTTLDIIEYLGNG